MPLKACEDIQIRIPRSKAMQTTAAGLRACGDGVLCHVGLDVRDGNFPAVEDARSQGG